MRRTLRTADRRTIRAVARDGLIASARPCATVGAVPRWLILAMAFLAPPAVAADWVLSVAEPRVNAGARFEFELLGPAGEKPPDVVGLRVRADRMQNVVSAEATAPAEGARRRYAAQAPRGTLGPLQLELVDRASNVLVLIVVAETDSLQQLTARQSEATEPPLSENESVYFIVGSHGDTTARFQLSFRYRMFDRDLGWGRDMPWLTGFYFAYTQTSIWNLSEDSMPFVDTSYRPSFFWQWRRTDDKTWIDGLRLGFEHESNGKEGADSRAVNILFARPEWRHQFANGKGFEFTPRLYGYLSKGDNPEIAAYRGYVDWRARYGDRERIFGAMARIGTSGKGSLTLDWFERTRVLGMGPVSGYLYVQYFDGYGESLLTYNQRSDSQLRIGFAIVP
jgi:phospholipase A1/A2